MKIKEILEDFICDKKLYIAIFNNNVYAYQYEKLLMLSKSVIVLSTKNEIIKIIGKEMTIKKMTKDELLIEGIINEIKKDNK